MYYQTVLTHQFINQSINQRKLDVEELQDVYS